MKLVLKVALLLPLFFGMLMLLESNMAVAGLECCGVPAAAEEIGTPAFMEAVPTIVTAGPGEVHTVHVTVLDKDKRPVPNVQVTASSDTPNRVSVEPEEARTDEKGMAIFTVKGVAYTPGSQAIITFKAGDVVDTIETVFQYL